MFGNSLQRGQLSHTCICYTFWKMNKSSCGFNDDDDDITIYNNDCHEWRALGYGKFL